MKKQTLETILEQNQSQYINDWKTLLEFPSISADPNHNNDCHDCADWLVTHLIQMGFSAELLQTKTKPCVYAKRDGDPDKPTILYYGHYDVQPVDPESEWDTPPFEPTMRNDRLYARGAQDNKGQVFYTLKAIETLIQNNTQLPTIKIILEGEEEYGSTALSNNLENWKARLQADILMVHDTCTIRSGNPTITMGLRGIIALCIDLKGANHDLHSGLHGGLAPNPAQGMAQLVAGLYNQDGSVAVENFYNKITQPTAKEQKLAAQVPFDAKEYQSMVGTTPDGGQKNISATERVGFQPSLDINGIHSGYGGDGMKTVIAAKASAKLSARLVPNQDPATVLEAIIKHLNNNTPKGMQLTITEQTIGGPGLRINPESAPIKHAKKALAQLSEKPVAFLWEGASIPIVTDLAITAGATPLLVGFGHEDDHIHAPNESFSIKQFKTGYLYTALALQIFEK